jgi:hypothetical protein
MAKKEKALFVLYGRTGLFRMACPECGLKGLVREGKTLCCNARIDRPQSFKKKREVEGAAKRDRLPIIEKRRILEEQDHCCIYCGNKFNEPIWHPGRRKVVISKISFDHLVCWNFSQNTRAENMVAACSLCNGIKSDKLFENIEQARAYIIDQRQRKGFDQKSYSELFGPDGSHGQQIKPARKPQESVFLKD